MQNLHVFMCILGVCSGTQAASVLSIFDEDAQLFCKLLQAGAIKTIHNPCVMHTHTHTQEHNRRKDWKAAVTPHQSENVGYLK